MIPSCPGIALFDLPMLCAPASNSCRRRLDLTDKAISIRRLTGSWPTGFLDATRHFFNFTKSIISFCVASDHRRNRLPVCIPITCMAIFIIKTACAVLLIWVDRCRTQN